MTLATYNSADSLPKYLRAEFRATMYATDKQRLAFGARMFHYQIRVDAQDRQAFAIACIKLQTWY